jgi:UDP-glucose-4-epimerase GalE
MSKRAVVVTGGAGYIGSHTCKGLARAGFLPVTIDNLVYGHAEAVKWGPFVQADLADLTALNAVFAEHQPLAVLHFAAFAYVGESVTAPEKYYRNNVAGTLNLLDAMLQHDCRRIVFSSSCATYGIPSTVPISEDQPQEPINPYGSSKLMVERILRDYERAHGLQYCALRYFNAAGADPDGEIGEDHTPETHLVPLVIEAALGRRPYVEVFGTDYPTSDGTAVRDFIHVADLAEAHERALAHLLADRGSAALNVGTGRGHSVREVIKAVQVLSGKDIPVRNSPRRPGDPPILVADPRRAQGVLGWQPRMPGLEDIVATAFRWHASRATRANAAQPRPATLKNPAFS